MPTNKPSMAFIQALHSGLFQSKDNRPQAMFLTHFPFPYLHKYKNRTPEGSRCIALVKIAQVGYALIIR